MDKFAMLEREQAYRHGTAGAEFQLELKACFDQIEHDFFKGPFVLGDDYSVCDMYLFTITQWLEADEVDVNWFPKVAAHRRWMLANPVVQKVLQSE